MKLQEAYVKGLCDGITAYAWMKDGTMYVGTTGRTLADALENAMNGTYPPQPNLAWDARMTLPAYDSEDARRAVLYADTVLNEHSPEGENIARVSLAGVHFLRSVAVGLAAIAAALEDR